MGFKDPGYITIEGTVYNPENNSPAKNAQLLAIVNTVDSSNSVFEIPVNEAGQFKVQGMIFTDSAKFTFRNNSSPKARTLVQLKPYALSNYFVTPNSNARPARFLPLSQSDIQQRKQALDEYISDENTLERITIKTRVKSKAQMVEERYVTGILGSNSNTTLDFINNPPPTSGINILDYLRSRLPSVTIGNAPDYILNFRQTRSITGGMIPMRLFVDEMEVDPSYVSTLRIDEIALVKVYSTGIFASPGGALALYTRKSGDRISNGAFGMVSTATVKGFSPAKEFYSPDYSTPNPSHAGRDVRTTLFWDPYLATDAQHSKLAIRFYSSDTVQPIKVVLQGMSTDGHLIYIEKIITPDQE
jgi:hypothetical protein